ncbi:hypothetical protein KJQ85_09215, partial [Campylobacter lari]
NVGATVDNIDNTGTIMGGGGAGIQVESGSKVGTINNSGNIGDGIVLGRLVENQNVVIETFNNNGAIINNKGYGTVFIVTSTIENFTNSGLIENSSGGDSGGIYTAGGKIGTFINENTG